MTLPLFFLVASSAALMFALGSLWNSLRTAFSNRVRLDARTVRDLPEHAALKEEKKALLRGIKDLEYEREVGKIGKDDYERLNRAYRARVKQVLQELDQDVAPLMKEAEALIAARAGVDVSARKSTKNAAKSTERADAKPSKSQAEDSSTAQSKSAVTNEEPDVDELVARIERGELDEAPEPPADWPESAKKFFRDTLSRALEEHRTSKQASPAPASSSSEPAS